MNRARRAGQLAPTMPVAVVARRLGVAPSTLRTWDRRYGLGPSRHTGGKHRRYGAADILRLELMQRALLSGASTAEAARFALDAVLPEPGEAPATPGTDPPEVLDGSAARRLRSAALAMDCAAVQCMLAEVIDDAGVLASWENVIDPVLTALGAGWHGARADTDAECLLAECVLGALVRATPVLTDPRNQRPVFLSGVPDEHANLPLYALNACLAGRRIGTQLFGTPPSADVLVVAVRHSAPAAIVLRAQRAEVADATLFSQFALGRQRGRVFAWGPGWADTPLPAKVESLSDLRAAAERIEYVLLGQ